MPYVCMLQRRERDRENEEINIEWQGKSEQKRTIERKTKFAKHSHRT